VALTFHESIGIELKKNAATLTVRNFIATVQAAVQGGCLSIFQLGERGKSLPCPCLWAPVLSA